MALLRAPRASLRQSYGKSIMPMSPREARRDRGKFFSPLRKKELSRVGSACYCGPPLLQRRSVLMSTRHAIRIAIHRAESNCAREREFSRALAPLDPLTSIHRSRRGRFTRRPLTQLLREAAETLC
jgi:hypothetical protein